MSAPWIWPAAVALAPLAYVTLVTLGVACLCAISAIAGRATPKDDLQRRAFEGVGAGPLARLGGLLVEGHFQALAFAKQVLHLLRLLRPPPRRPGATPVVVLPGYTENAGTMHTLGTRLARAGYDPILLDFPSTFSAVEHNARWLGERLQALCAELGVKRIDVVGHSMGGLITRTLVQADPDHRVRTLVAVASPFRGTEMARIGAWLRGGHSTHNMMPGGEYMLRFPPTLEEPVPLLSLVALQEDIISPPWNSILPGADNVVLPRAYGHVAPLFVPSAFEIIQGWLRRQARTAAERGS